MEQHPFQTNNMSLAVALLCAGIPHPVNDKGQLVPGFNIYDKNILAGLGYKGWPLEKAVEDAIAKGRPGVVVYNFARSDRQAEICRAFDKAATLLKDLDNNGNPESQTAFTINCPHCNKSIGGTAFAKIGCIVLKTRKTVAGLWKNFITQINVHGQQRTERDANGKETTTGSFKSIPLNASPETKRRLGL